MMRWIKGSLTIAAIVAAGLIVVAAQTPIKNTLLIGKTIEQEVSAGQKNTYEIKLEGGQFAYLVVDQKSTDVASSVNGPAGHLASIDNLNITRGPELILFVAPATGVHRIEVTAKESGRYGLLLQEARPAGAADLPRIEAENTFLEAEKLMKNGDYGAALGKYDAALKLIPQGSDRFRAASINYALGRAANALGDKGKAAEYFRTARQLFQAGGSWDEVFRDMTALYLIMGGKQKTLDYLADAIPLVRALKNERLEAILLTGLTKICDDMNLADKSLEYLDQALSLYRITGKRGAEVFNLTEIADADLSLENKNKALGYMNQAIMLSQGANDKALEVTLLLGIGYIYSSLDQYDKSLATYRQAIPLWRSLGDKNGEGYTLNFIASTYLYLGDPVTARDNFENARILFRETGDRRAEAYSDTNLGVIENRAGNQQKAREFFQNALAIFRETGERHGEALVLSYLAEISWYAGDSRSALDSYQKSNLIYRQINFREGEASTLSNMGFIYEQMGDIAKASESHTKSLATFRLLGERAGEAMSLYGVARAAYRRGEMESSLSNIEAAIALIESIRTTIDNTELRASYLANYQYFYQFYIDLLMGLDQKQPGKGFDARAVKVSEQAKARSMLDLLTESRADIRRGVNPDLLNRERALQKQMGAKDRERARAATPEQIEKIEKELRALAAAYKELQGEIRVKNPRYAALTQPAPAGLAEIQKMLDPDTLLLEYSLGQENSYLWVISRDSLKSYRLPKAADIETKARAFYESLRRPEIDPKNANLASELGRILVGPATAELGSKRLVVVADGALAYVPFAALAVKTDNSPLIMEHEVVYLPSASTLAALRDDARDRRSPSKAIAVIADPVFDATDTRVNKTSSTGSPSTANAQLTRAAAEAGLLKVLPRLPGTRNEATTILSLVPESQRKRAIDFEASKITVTGEDLADYRLVHFATHGLLNSRHPELSGIVLSLVDEKGAAQDGFLRLNEIYNLRLQADLVTLSACQTALGKEIKGEGLIGLTRGFMYAGAPRVVASIWSVDDLATGELMKNFYQGMLGDKKLSPAAALRQAQISLINTKRFNNPYYWAAFELQGDWR